jgi:Ser-tRNA(Ala) deacylase AlaX
LLQTHVVFVHKDKMHELCRNVPTNIPENKPVRVVMYGTFGVPCGGTHVAQLGDIKDITIRKVKLEKGAIRVSYDVPR